MASFDLYHTGPGPEVARPSDITALTDCIKETHKLIDEQDKRIHMLEMKIKALENGLAVAMTAIVGLNKVG